MDPAAFGAAVQRAAGAAEQVDRTRAADDGVTQFEMPDRGGLRRARPRRRRGRRHRGRPRRPPRRHQRPAPRGRRAHQRRARAHAMARHHRRRHRAREAGRPARRRHARGRRRPASRRHARGACRRRGAMVRGSCTPIRRGRASWPPWASYQRRNFAVARAAAEAQLGTLDEDRVRRAAATVQVPGRFEVVGRDPLTIVDGAHNEPGIAAAVASVPDGRRHVAGGVDPRRQGCAAAMLDAAAGPLPRAGPDLQPEPPGDGPGRRSRSLARRLGAPASRLRVESDPRRALELARGLAGRRGAVLATGSIYLVAELLARPGRPRAMSTL